MNTIHVGVQSSKENAKAEIITAVLLLHICKQPDTDLGKLCIDLVKGLPQLFSVLQQDDTGTVNGISQVKKDYRGKAEEMVQLFCYCQTPWVDGSTSAALYGNSQRDFNMYNCSKCDNWFHKYCLSACDITIPKRNADFFCSACTVPESLPWMHNEYTNTCTSDNFLTILSLHCKQYKSFLDTFGDSEAENSLKAAIVLMNKGKLDEGKTLFLHLLQSRLNLTISQENNLKYDCFGGENNRCLCLFTHIWKLVIKLKCTSEHCPNHNTEVTKYPSTFSFSSGLDNFNEIFPIAGDMVGYYGAEFHCQPPNESLHAVTDRLNLTGRNRETFYECRGVPQVMASSFLNRVPWMIPIDIQSLTGRSILTIPKVLTIYGHGYQLAGCTVCSDNHFTAVCFWYGHTLYYDGMRSHRIQPFKLNDFQNKTGSYAYYFRQL